MRATLLPVILLAGCASFGSYPLPRQMELTTDEAAMKAIVQQHIFVGMPVEDAKVIMQAHGFECSFEEHHCWMANEDKSITGPCLVCSRYMPNSTFVISNEIKVYLLVKEGKITDLRVEHISTCL
jgi:hypothetical protein